VNISAVQTMLGTPGPVVSGKVSVDYWAGSKPYIGVEGAAVTFPSTITVQIVDGELAEPLDLVPTGGVCCVRVVIRAAGKYLSRFVEIPDTGPVDFGDMPEVDPVAFAPVTPTTTLLQQIQDALRDRF
jgi:hypothetical protein